MLHVKLDGTPSETWTSCPLNSSHPKLPTPAGCRWAFLDSDDLDWDDLVYDGLEFEYDELDLRDGLAVCRHEWVD